MSTAQHHNEWLALIDISGPFLSLPVLTDVFPQGLDNLDSDTIAELRAVYDVWADSQRGLRADPLDHEGWLRYILRHILDVADEGIVDCRNDCPTVWQAHLQERGLTLQPDFALHDPEADKPSLFIQLYPERQALEKRLKAEGRSTSETDPATRMMELLRATDVPLGLLTNGEAWMLVYAPRGETVSYVTWRAELWLEERLTLRAFYSLLNMGRFFGVPQHETLPALFARSANNQHDVTDQLGYQVRQAVEILVQALAKANADAQGQLLDGVDAKTLYEAALTVMMRLVFLLSAEARGLLLLGDPDYDQHYAVSTLRAQLREAADRVGIEIIERRSDAWCRLLATFRAIYTGIWHQDLRLPAYGGSLFDPDRFPFLEGRSQYSVNSIQYSEDARPNTEYRIPSSPPAIDNRTVLHLLEALQLLRLTVGGMTTVRALSFRALDVEQIGHVYEGLLDHQAVIADEVVLGLGGTKNHEPEIALSELEGLATKQPHDKNKKLLKFIKDATGRSSTKTVARRMTGELDAGRRQRLLAVCGNDDALLQRVLPWAGLIRDDAHGMPVVVLPGSVYVTAGATRRQTGTHYTPRELTEPIVQHTLEPLVYVGPAEGWPRDKWQLRRTDELLNLKICDMAMGSGAFLVQVCRYLAERVVESVETPNTEHRIPNTDHWPSDPDERFLMAKRLVADRCLYGVDKNHLAVEMAKLSLWLVTLGKGRAFTFLDHALRHGDSLIGTDEAAYDRWWQTLQGANGWLYEETNREAKQTALRLRRELRDMPMLDVRDAAEKERLLAEAEAATARIRRACDLLAGVKLLGLKKRARETLLAKLLIEHTAREELVSDEAQRALAAARRQEAFHWAFEFPEVFAQGGFNAFVGNPPFVGGQRIRAAFGEDVLYYLKARWDHARGSADFSTYFFLRAFESLRRNGTLGLIATNTIAQGATRELGLDHIHEQGGEIYHAYNDYAWPGQAAVFVDIVHIMRGKFAGQKRLDDKPVKVISPLLDDMLFLGNPHRLAANQGLSFQGSNVLGLGFTMLPEEAQAMIESNPANADVLFPYLNGQDLNSHPEQQPSRWVINFFDWPLNRSANGVWSIADDKQRTKWLRTGKVPGDYPNPVATDYPDCLAIVRENVYPQRMAQRREIRKRYWWRYGEVAPALYRTIASLHYVIVRTRVTRTHAPVMLRANGVFSEATVVFATDSYGYYSVLQSSFHEAWAWQYASTLKGDLRYSATNVFENFPFPFDKIALEALGKKYHLYRQACMIKKSKGLTAIYNCVDDENNRTDAIESLRKLHVEMDTAVAAAYGWSDIELGHGFHPTAQGVRFTISDPARRELLHRLLQLNHERYAEEVAAGLHDKKKKGAKGKGRGAGKKKPTAQGRLF